MTRTAIFKTWSLRPIVAMMAALAFLAIAQGSEGADLVSQKVKLTLTGSIPGATGMAELELRINTQGQIFFQARARAKGLDPNQTYSLCVEDGSMPIFIDSDEANAKGEVSVGPENPMVNFSSLSGLGVIITKGGSCDDPVALSGTIL